jgi:hypothetical protein
MFTRLNAQRDIVEHGLAAAHDRDVLKIEERRLRVVVRQHVFPYFCLNAGHVAFQFRSSHFSQHCHKSPALDILQDTAPRPII